MNYSRSKIYNIDEDTLVGKRGEKKLIVFTPVAAFRDKAENPYYKNTMRRKSKH